MDETLEKPTDYWRILKICVRYVGIIIMFSAMIVGFVKGSPYLPRTPEGWFWFGSTLVAATEALKK